MNMNRVVFAASCIALNVGLAKVANLLQLPIYLDTPGTILAAIMLPWYWAIGVAILSSLVGSLVINGVWIYYVGTQVVVSLLILGAAHFKLFIRWWTSLLCGVVVGLAAAIVSAPVTVVIFGGVTLPGPTAINAVLIAAGKSIWQSVLAGSIIIEMLDKPAATLLTWLVLKRLPKSIVSLKNAKS
jgi:energy-coupling factor transport system substrate-specific component